MPGGDELAQHGEIGRAVHVGERDFVVGTDESRQRITKVLAERD